MKKTKTVAGKVTKPKPKKKSTKKPVAKERIVVGNSTSCTTEVTPIPQRVTIILPIMSAVQSMIEEWAGIGQKCGCGALAEVGLSFCTKCRLRMVDDFNVLCKTLCATHRGAGGAAICICGAGCGGSPSCSALSMLQTAIVCNDQDLRYSIAEIAGWGGLMDTRSKLDTRGIKGLKPIQFVKSKDYDVYYGKTSFGNFYYTIQDNRGFSEDMRKSEAKRTKLALANFTWWCDSYNSAPEFQAATTLEGAIELCHADLLQRIKSSFL